MNNKLLKIIEFFWYGGIKSKRYKRIYNIISIPFFIYVLMVLYPNLLFSYSVSYKNYTVFSNEVMEDHIYSILDSVDKQLSTSDVYDNTIKHKIFISDNYKLYTFLSHMYYKTSGITYVFFNNHYITKSEIKNDVSIKNSEGYNKTSLTHVITHESMHTLLQERLGLIKYLSLPKWMMEGYCEYISDDSIYDYDEGIEQLKTGKKDKSKSFNYFQYRIMVEYLFDVEKITFDDFVEKDFDFSSVELKMIESLRNST